MLIKGQNFPLFLLDRLSLLAIGLCGGGAGYFLLRFEPPPTMIIVLFMISLMAMIYGFWRHHDRLFLTMFATASLAFGAGYAQYSTLNLQENFSFYAAPETPVYIEGELVDEEFLAQNAWRLTLKNVRIDDQPLKGKIRVRSEITGPRGSRVSGTARLYLPSAPVIPGGFDFQRYAFFRQFAAVGYFLYHPKLIFEKQEESLISIWRAHLYEIVARDFSSSNAAVVRALLLGDRQSLSEQQKQDFRQSGLAHLLAISGMHIGMISLLVFAFLCKSAAVFPRIVLYHPVHRYAAVVAVVMAYFYVLLTEGSVSVQRAFIMIAFLMMGWALERGSIRFRSLAIAAVAIFLLRPHVVMEASFQLSFSAVLILIGYYLFRRKHPFSSHTPKIVAGITDLFMSSLLISLVTMPLIWGHFQTVYPLGAIANIAAIPWMGVLIMPAIVLYALGGFIGLETLVAPLLELSLEILLWWAGTMAEITISQLSLPFLPEGLMLAGVCTCLALLLASQIKVVHRVLGYSFVMGGMVLYAYGQPLPIVIVERSIPAWALVSQEGMMIPPHLQVSRYVRHAWQTRLNLPIRAWQNSGDSSRFHWSCETGSCTIMAKNTGKFLRITNRCPQPRQREKTVLIGISPCEEVREGAPFAAGKTFALFLDDQGFMAYTLAEERGSRPWVAAR